MNRSTRQAVLFATGIAMAIAAALVELGLAISIYRSGDVGTAKAIATIVNGLFVFGAIRMVLDAWRNQFVSPAEVLNHQQLSDCHSQRLSVVAAPCGRDFPHTVHHLNRSLIQQYLILLERLLAANLGRHHYELSIFCGADEPEIVGYFDSNGNSAPRSYTKRAANPLYYVENNYEVVEVLKDPSTETHYIENTHSDSEDYSFTSEEQRGKVRSSLIHCIDVRWPAAIVITCDKEKVLGNERAFRDALLSIYFGIATDLYLSILMRPEENTL